MSIGQAGKQAQNFGQRRQNQYQLDYNQADSLPLNPPRRRAPAPVQSTNVEPEVQRASQPAHSTEAQQSSVQENKSEQFQTTADTVQREVAVNEAESSPDEGDLVQNVADRVFELMLKDVKKDRERSGGRFR